MYGAASSVGMLCWNLKTEIVQQSLTISVEEQGFFQIHLCLYHGFYLLHFDCAETERFMIVIVVCWLEGCTHEDQSAR